jgi:hypothetical protein
LLSDVCPKGSRRIPRAAAAAGFKGADYKHLRPGHKDG